jgi:hypothetical protein
VSKLKLAAAILALFVVIGAGIFLLRAAQPNIVLAPEEIFTLGPLTVVNTLITAVVITVFLTLISYFATRDMKLIPSGLQNVVEAAVEAYYNIVRGVAGDTKARIFIPLAGTIFIFIAFSNGAGLLPIFGAVGKFESAEHVLEHEIDIEDEGDTELVEASGGFKLIGIDPNTIEVEWLPESATFDGPDGEEHTVTFAESADAHDKAHTITEGLEEAGFDPEQYGHLLPLFRSVNTDLTVPLSMPSSPSSSLSTWASAHSAWATCASSSTSAAKASSRSSSTPSSAFSRPSVKSFVSSASRSGSSATPWQARSC